MGSSPKQCSTTIVLPAQTAGQPSELPDCELCVKAGLRSTSPGDGRAWNSGGFHNQSLPLALKGQPRLQEERPL